MAAGDPTHWQRRLWRHFDYGLLAATVAVTFFGLAMIYSANIGTPDRQDLVWKQATFAVVGLVGIVALAALDYQLLGSLEKPIYVTANLVLLLTRLFGYEQLGAKRWVSIGGVTFQPSEFAKLMIIIALAHFLARREARMGRLRTVLLSLAYIALPALLIFQQPDLSTAIVLLVIWLAMAFTAGMRLRHLLLLFLIVALATPLIWSQLEPYQHKRVLQFLGLINDPDTQYNIDQARIAIGSGGWLGKGFARGSQSQLHFLKVRHTDFIFSVIGEEMGFLGGTLLMLLLAFIVYRACRAALLARDTFGRLIAVGIATLIFFQATVNIGMNLGLLPVTGIPLPFVSYGRSALLSLLLGLGLVESVVMRYRKLDF